MHDIGRLLLVNALALLVFMSLAFMVARRRSRLDTVDMAWGGAFVLVAVVVLVQSFEWKSALIALLVLRWGSRLFLHIFRRARRRGEDERYIEMSKKWGKHVWLKAYFIVFLFQGLLVWVISLPIVFAAGKPLDSTAWLVVLGALLWLFGNVFESVADRQLAAFISNPKNKGKIMQSGLWRYSRHPNYFGEITQWWAIGAIALSAEHGWIGLIGPLVLTLLIIFVSGIPPIERRKKSDPVYREYMRRTSPLVPWPRR